jgi:signal transduction histidine kinase
MSQVPFNVSARTARLIGQENFATADGAVIELVKNCYDADASICLVILDTVTDSLYLIDNGDGMTEDVIRSHWMTIGTDNKQFDFKSVKKRVKTGAKGIGRFALDRLGKQCEMITKTADHTAVIWTVDWTQFEQKNKNISDIFASVNQISSFEFDSYIAQLVSDLNIPSEILTQWEDNKGTVIKIKNLKDDWDEKSIADLYSNLEILIPPLETNVFKIFFYWTEKPIEYGPVSSALFDDYDYKLKAICKSDGDLEVIVERKELNVDGLDRLGFFTKSKLSGEQYSEEAFKNGSYTKRLNVTNLLPGFKNIDNNKILSKVGPFDFTFFFLKRGGGQEKEEGHGKYPYNAVSYHERAFWLDRFGGVKIFRDNFRVRPYGETNGSAFDWLDLGKRALSNPTVTRPGYRVRPQQVYGVINISRLDNSYFQDKSSREGLQENEIFMVFKEILKGIIEIFENDRNQIMMSLKKIYDDANPKENAKAKADKLIKSRKKSKTDGSNVTPAIIQDGEKIEEEEEVLIDAYEAIKEEIDDLVDEQKLLRVLASAGLIVTSFAHELKNLSDRIVPRSEEMRVILDKVIDKDKLASLPDYEDPYIMLDDMKKQDARLENWLKFALSAVRKDKRSRKIINMVAYVEELNRTWVPLLEKRGIILTIDKKHFVEVNFSGHEIDLDGIFNNLIANSIDAFKRVDADDNRIIKLSFVFEAKAGITTVVYEDSGPGLSEDITDPNIIFQPFFTTKRERRTGEKTGTGLGMWIVKSSIESYKGTTEFLETKNGFKLKLVLPHNI